MNSAGEFFTTQTDGWQRKIGEAAVDVAAVCLRFLLILFALILLGVGFVCFSATNKPSGIAATAAVLLPSTTFTRQTYIAARQKFNQFFADPAERRITRIGIQSDCEPVLHYDPCNPTPSS